jgi:hypothetical protein
VPLNFIMILISIPAALLSLVGIAWLTMRNEEERYRSHPPRVRRNQEVRDHTRGVQFV